MLQELKGTSVLRNTERRMMLSQYTNQMLFGDVRITRELLVQQFPCSRFPLACPSIQSIAECSRSEMSAFEATNNESVAMEFERTTTFS
jgi:hypothetical protein